jgi:hypothetical protein
MGFSSFLKGLVRSRIFWTLSSITLLGGLAFSFQNCGDVVFSGKDKSRFIAATSVTLDFNAAFQQFEGVTSTTPISSMTLSTSGSSAVVNVRMLNNGAMAWPNAGYKLVVPNGGVSGVNSNLIQVQPHTSSPTNSVGSGIAMAMPMVISLGGQAPQGCSIVQIRFRMAFTNSNEQFGQLSDPLNVNIGASCNCPTNAQAQGNACVCDTSYVGFPDGTCQCPSGATLVNGACTCPPNSTVSGTVCQCPVNASIQNGQCQCDPGYQLSNGVCQCAPNNVSCQCPVNQVRNPTTGACECGPGFQADSSGSCHCNTVNTCSCPAHSNVNPTTLQCQCDPTYFPTSNNTACNCPVGASVVNNQCQCPNNSTPVTDSAGVATCQCSPGFSNVNGVCTCNSISACNCGPNTQVTTPGVCSCKNTFVSINGQCQCPTGANVGTDGACHCPTNSHPNGNVCACDAGFAPDTNGVCKCNDTTTCQCGPNSQVTNGQCACLPGFTKDAGGVCKCDNVTTCGCTPNSTVSPLGVCACALGFTLQNGLCKCNSIASCGCGPNQQVSPLGQCSCNSTYIPNGSNSCGCPSGANVVGSVCQCGPNSSLNGAGDSCVCAAGFTRDTDGVCKCSTTTSCGCGVNSHVAPLGQCACDAGYILNGGICKCNSTTTCGCGANQSVVSPGVCACNAGFHDMGNGTCLPVGTWSASACTATPGTCNAGGCQGTKVVTCLNNGVACTSGTNCWCDPATKPATTCTTASVATHYYCSAWNSCSPACNSSCTETCASVVPDAWGVPGSTPGNTSFSQTNYGPACPCNDPCGCETGKTCADGGAYSGLSTCCDSEPDHYCRRKVCCDGGPCPSNCYINDNDGTPNSCH